MNPKLKAVLEKWKDPNTPDDKQTTKVVSSTGNEEVYILVASDEFQGNSIKNDAFWIISEEQFTDTDSVAFKGNQISVQTQDEGFLQMRFSDKDSSDTFNPKVKYYGAQLQSWDRFCFTGGVLEVKAALPTIAGVWSSVFLMGNLARSGYKKSSDHVWAWTYEEGCEAKNAKQKFMCNTKYQISARDKEILGNKNRGAPGINLFQAALNGSAQSLFMGLDIAPSIPEYYRPAAGSLPAKTQGAKGSWYRDLEYGSGGGPYPLFYGFENYSDAVCGSTSLSVNDNSGDDYHVYRLEWIPGNANGSVTFYVDGEKIFKVPASAFDAYEALNTTGKGVDMVKRRTFLQEPQTINFRTTVVSMTHWGMNDTDIWKEKSQGEMKIDYIRVYQHQDRVSVGCNPPKYPTTEYIDNHNDLYGGQGALPPENMDALYYYYDGNTTLDPAETVGPSATTPVETNSGGTSNTLTIILATVGGLILLLAAVLAVFLLFFRKNYQRKDRAGAQTLQRDNSAGSIDERKARGEVQSYARDQPAYQVAHQAGPHVGGEQLHQQQSQLPMAAILIDNSIPSAEAHLMPSVIDAYDNQPYHAMPAQPAGNPTPQAPTTDYNMPPPGIAWHGETRGPLRRRGAEGYPDETARKRMSAGRANGLPENQPDTRADRIDPRHSHPPVLEEQAEPPTTLPTESVWENSGHSGPHSRGGFCMSCGTGPLAPAMNRCEMCLSEQRVPEDYQSTAQITMQYSATPAQRLQEAELSHEKDSNQYMKRPTRATENTAQLQLRPSARGSGKFSDVNDLEL